MYRRFLYALSLILALPAIAGAQILPFSIAIDGRVSSVSPTGEFASSEDGFASEGGIGYAIGGSIFPLRALGVFAGYQHSEFGCEQCASLGLDDSAIVKGLEAGVHVGIPFGGPALAPWVRGGIVHQTLGFTTGDDGMSSSPEIGFTAAAGLAIPIGDLIEINPALRYFTMPAEFDFTDFPDRSLDVSAYAVDVGASLRF